MALERRARVSWEGDLAQGGGMVSAASGAFTEQQVSWPARTEEPDGKTSPEELIAAAHASCYAMAFSSVLAKRGHPPEHLELTATVTFEPKEGGGGYEVTSSRLEARGRVPGLDQAAFAEAAEEGEQGCPVSNALRGSLDISVDARLDDD